MSTATGGIRVTLRRNSNKHVDPFDVSEFSEAHKVPPPRYRHAAPSAPWPWMDFDQDVADVRPLTPIADAEPWTRYPQSHFGNWTPDQVGRCRMLTICDEENQCQIHKVDVLKDGLFYRPESDEGRRLPIPIVPAKERELWDYLEKPLSHLRVRVIFIENITLSVLKILGASYNVEPFFFASSANWIPSRYQEDPHHGIGDHITVVLPFIRTVNNQIERPTPLSFNEPIYAPEKGLAPLTDVKHTIDTQAPLVLSDKKILLQDLLAIHMVRNVKQNVIISYHHNSELQKTTAKRLRSLVQRTGDSVYWSKIYGRSEDPTFVFLAILWYALYAWDEALEVLYAHLSEQLEATDSTTHLAHTRELHKLQAHLLYYQQLLRDFRKSVEFVRDTPNPAMEQDSITLRERESSQKLMNLETNNLLSEIERLEKQRKIQSDRLDNAMKLAYSSVNIEDNKLMKNLTMATLRDSTAMKQISYLTMIFLPASFLSSVFGMNVVEINPGTSETLPAYIESTVILTAVTVWAVIALHEHSSFHPGGRHVIHRVLWPLFYGFAMMQTMVAAIKQRLRKRR